MPSWSSTGLVDRQELGFLRDREEQSSQCTAIPASSLTLLLEFMSHIPPAPSIPEPHITHTHALLTLSHPLSPVCSSINTWHSRPSLCTSHATFLRRKFMGWLSHFTTFLQAFQRGGNCAYNMLGRTFPRITFKDYGYHLQWDGRLQLDLSFWWTQEQYTLRTDGATYFVRSRTEKLCGSKWHEVVAFWGKIR